MNVLKYYPTIADVDFEAWHEKAGVTCVISDVDSTLVEYGSSEVFPEAVAALKKAKDAGHIAWLGVFTHNKDQESIELVVEQIGADAWYTPLSKSERKPDPTMLYRAMREFSVGPEQMGVVGDKFTADIKAAMKAGVARAAWVDRYGKPDHFGDRLFRRPYEAPTKAMVIRTDGRLY